MAKTKSLGELLRYFREDVLGWDLPRLAAEVEKLGYKTPRYNAIRRYENGEIDDPKMSNIAAIVDAMGLSQREAMELFRASAPRPKRRKT